MVVVAMVVVVVVGLARAIVEGGILQRLVWVLAVLLSV